MIGPDVLAWLRSVRADLGEWVGVLEADGVVSMKDIEDFDQERTSTPWTKLCRSEKAGAPRLTRKLLLSAISVAGAASSAAPSSSDV